MAQCQARKWQSRHRHMALVMMAMQFMLESRIAQAELASCAELLRHPDLDGHHYARAAQRSGRGHSAVA